MCEQVPADAGDDAADAVFGVANGLYLLQYPRTRHRIGTPHR
jgi:hypothetical protein